MREQCQRRSRRRSRSIRSIRSIRSKRGAPAVGEQLQQQKLLPEMTVASRRLGASVLQALLLAAATAAAAANNTSGSAAGGQAPHRPLPARRSVMTLLVQHREHFPGFVDKIAAAHGAINVAA